MARLEIFDRLSALLRESLIYFLKLITQIRFGINIEFQTVAVFLQNNKSGASLTVKLCRKSNSSVCKVSDKIGFTGLTEIRNIINIIN